MFFLGTHEPHWLGHLDVPLFVSARRLRRSPFRGRARGVWALDSGGFTELSMFGQWTVEPQRYADEVAAWSESIGGMAWAAPQDWMCEPWILDKTGRTVDNHQALTVESVATLRGMGAPVIPVVQGWTVADYHRCIRRYEAAGVDLCAEPIVGVGTVCRRQGTAEGAEILRTIASCGIAVHAFGVKRTGLAAAGQHVTSSDSLAWSAGARTQRIRLPGCAHQTCANCQRYALMWREETVAAWRRGARQLSLFGGRP